MHGKKVRTTDESNEKKTDCIFRSCISILFDLLYRKKNNVPDDIMKVDAFCVIFFSFLDMPSQQSVFLMLNNEESELVFVDVTNMKVSVQLNN